MKKEIKGTFLSLNPNAKIFEEIKIQQPKWWHLMCKDKELYIDIRKDNYINIYYSGGSVANIHYSNGFVAKTHQKYFGDNKPRGKTKKGRDVFKYDNLDLENFNESTILGIKKHITKDYSRHINGEKPSEKWIQGKLILENPNYIDSEFQFNQDTEIGKLRIDLVEYSEGTLTFIELKGIFDGRLRKDIMRNSKIPEIIEQMIKYKMFINKYEPKIIEYYNKLIEIKRTLGLGTIEKPIIKLNKNPKLIIANTYKKITNDREKRIMDIKNLLENYSIEYEII
jgi:hypothetical protein